VKIYASQRNKSFHRLRTREAPGIHHTSPFSKKIFFTAFTRTAMPEVFTTKSSAPILRALTGSIASSFPVMTITGGGWGWNISLILKQTSKPETFGITTSVITRSGSTSQAS